jgi:IS30 family transposase
MKKTKSLNTTLTEDDFILIKKLLELKLPVKEIIRLSKRSEGTIGAFKRCNTFEEYKAYSKERTLKNKLKAENKPISLVASLEEQQVQVDTAIDNLTNMQHLVEAVNRIADNVQRLAEAWERQPEKKGWLK